MRSSKMYLNKLSTAALLLMLSGCGLAALPPVSVTIKPAEDQAVAETPTTETKGPGTETTAPATTDVVPTPGTKGGTGEFAGTVTLTGEPPKLTPLVAAGADVRDKETCSVVEVPNEAIVVDSATMGVENVFVYLEKAPAGAAPIPPPEKQIFDQKGCRFLPHAMIVRTKVPLLVLSEDDVAHNTHTYPNRNSVFNSAIGKKERKGIPVNYNQSEKEPIEVKCDFHTWMKAYHLPLDHGFATVTNAKGEFSIKGLPAGSYSFKVWHESAGSLERGLKVVIKAGENPKVELKYAAAKFSK